MASISHMSSIVSRMLPETLVEADKQSPATPKCTLLPTSAQIYILLVVAVLWGPTLVPLIPSLFNQYCDLILTLAFCFGLGICHLQAKRQKSKRGVSTKARPAPPPRSKPPELAKTIGKPPVPARSPNKDGKRAVAFNIQIDRAAKEGDVLGAEHWFMKLSAAGLEANTITYNSVIHACARTGDVERAARWLNKMISHGVEANAITYNAVIDACAKAGDASSAEEWLEKMLEAGVAANVYSYSTVISACAR